MHRILLTLTCLVLGMSAHASGKQNIYKWVDSAGQTHFSTEPPPEASGRVQRYSVDPSPPDPSHATRKDTVTGQARAPSEYQRIGVEDPETARRRDEIRAENCKIARQNFKLLDAGGRIRGLGADGNETVFDDEEMARQKGMAQDQIKKYCN
jgi:hypothetical protein